MLNMKHTWKAVMTLGLALLLGPGLVMAQDLHRLDGTPPTGSLVYAKETLGAVTTRGQRPLELPADGRDIVVAPRRAIAVGSDIFVRIDLTGAVFGDTIPRLVYRLSTETDAEAALTLADEGQLSSGGQGMSFAVFQLPTTGASIAAGSTTPGGLIGVRIPDGDAVDTPDDLLVTPGATSVSAAITAYTDPDDALDAEDARTTFRGSGTIIRLVSGLSVTIAPAPAAVADVDRGFMRFVGNMGQARLGWLGVEEKFNMPTTPEGADAPVDSTEVRNAGNGDLLERGDILDIDANDAPEGMVNFDISGNLNIGAFRLIPESDDYVAATDTGGETCPAVAAGAVDQGNLIDPTATDPTKNLLINEEGELPTGVNSASSGPMVPGLYLLCLNVDVMGPMTNTTAIPVAAYTATAHIDPDGIPTNLDGEMVGEDSVGSIRRNGASVEIPYLTTSEKHNQRLIVVNRGTSPVPIRAITYTTEEGVNVVTNSAIQALLDSGKLEVPPQSSWVVSMKDTIEISGRGPMRTAATIAFAATAGNISVATTQVNRSDGSTDTVVYDIDGL